MTSLFVVNHVDPEGMRECATRQQTRATNPSMTTVSGVHEGNGLERVNDNCPMTTTSGVPKGNSPSKQTTILEKAW